MATVPWICACVLAVVSLLTSSRSAEQGQDPVSRPAAIDDLSSLDGTIGALYAAVSAGQGEVRDEQRIRNLFDTEARLRMVMATEKDLRGITMTVEDYLVRSGTYQRSKGFFERELRRQTRTFGAVAQVWSSYVAYEGKPDGRQVARGVNALQLRFDGKRWWITDLLWQAESKDLPLPAELLPEGGKVK